MSNTYENKKLSKVTYSDTAKKSALQPHKEHKFAKVNCGKRHTGKLPEWITKNTNPSQLGVTQNDGMFTKTLGELTFYWCEKCLTKNDTKGRWNKHHPTKAHTKTDDNHHSSWEGKRKSVDRSNDSYTEKLEKRIRALEGKK